MAAEQNGASSLKEANTHEGEGRVLITFDVDGTLVRSVGDDANRMHKGAFSHAFRELFGVEGTIDAIKVLRSATGVPLVCTTPVRTLVR